MMSFEIFCRNKLLLIFFYLEAATMIQNVKLVRNDFYFSSIKTKTFFKDCSKITLFLFWDVSADVLKRAFVILLMLCCCTIWSMQWICLHKRKQDRHWLSQFFKYHHSVVVVIKTVWEELSNLKNEMILKLTYKIWISNSIKFN